jgi:hypothetical protein
VTQIDLDRVLAIACGIVLFCLVWIALLLVSGIDWKRATHYWQVWFDQHLTTNDRRFWRNVGRMLYIYILVLIGWGMR